MAAVIVKTASHLKHITDVSFPEIFVSNINNIYAHEDEDICTILKSKNVPLLKDLWNKLISWLQDQYDPCKNRSPLVCKNKKPLIISEISLICRFLTAPIDSNPKLDLDCFFFYSNPLRGTIQGFD